jgi:hypothetical protein
MNEVQNETCRCNPCQGAGCACGCQGGVAAKACDCGPECRCGGQCAKG